MSTDTEIDTRIKFGPSMAMPVGMGLVHPLFYVGVLTALFECSSSFRTWLWEWRYAPWRKFLMSSWDFFQSHPWFWMVPLIVTLFHIAVRFSTTRYSYTEDYLFIESGLFSFGTRSGFFSQFKDPIAFSTISDANASRGLIGLLTGTGTIYIKTSDMDHELKITWVPDVSAVQQMVMSKAGVRNARMLSTVRS